ncbi:type IVB secretion system protein IcmX [Legionella fairfieldensis]|uniref:type IVB secretion system protein IcmX n=1 Tax=Legionella fairfieldensis TaxID=45064 RepID=UPI00048B912D|nr:type IVB secretion system protein IcmX [Legionella fairfieldensis]
MKLPGVLVLPGFLLLATSLFASDGNPPGNSGANDNSDLPTYLLNLGAYLGYNLQNSPTSTSGTGSTSSTAPTISQNLLNLPATQVIQNYLFNTFLGSLLVNTAAPGTTQFVPASSQTYSAINAFANYTFTTPPYASPSPEQVSVSPLVDQPPYQNDPVSQAVMNILTTPSFSYCLNNDGTAIANCSYSSGTLNANQVVTNVIGTIPNTQNYFTPNQIQPFLAQLNSNSLLAPLLYTTTSSASNSTSSSAASDSGNTNQGLVAQTQAQQAANFIRFVSGLVSPLSMPNRNDYDALYIQALNASNTYTPVQQQQAQAALATYLANMKTYAAQYSVGLGNLYYMLSRRLPQNQSTSSAGQQTSQELSEFTMATWRLYNPDQSPNTQWLAQINQASAATVQKEIATLLAEINYQLYLTRHQQERLLLTNTIMLLQNTVVNTQPSLTSNKSPSS